MAKLQKGAMVRVASAHKSTEKAARAIKSVLRDPSVSNRARRQAPQFVYQASKKLRHAQIMIDNAKIVSHAATGISAALIAKGVHKALPEKV